MKNLKKYILCIISFFILNSCGSNIYEGGQTKYSSLTDIELKQKGDEFEKDLEKKYGIIDIEKLKKLVDEKQAIKKFLLRDEEKIEYDNILIEGINRAYKKSGKNLSETLKKIKNKIKNLKSREEYALFIFYDKI